MSETKACRSHARSKQSNLLQLGNCVPANSHFHIERKLIRPTARKCTHDALERSGAAPAIVVLRGSAIKTECHMSDCRTMLEHLRPDAFEMPAISHKAALQA